MQIEEITLSLKERGVVWQSVGFAVFGTASLAALSVYSDSHHWIITTYRLAAIELNWAYIRTRNTTGPRAGRAGSCRAYQV